MLGKRTILIFLLSVNIYAQFSLSDELEQLKELSNSVNLEDWNLEQKPQVKKKKEIIEDSIGLTSSALQKNELQDQDEDKELEELFNDENSTRQTIRYRSR
ncbi:hypothetical protein BIY24_07400 [Halobacteriovorax marinus]|uniref:hypothetical protein n=1 Tax=Halobacteriovorax marinus TaxID=97084 RepID=UPI000BC2FAA9|nr:hypothetical protein [Halobacteriovorax marinus]ATH07778.1 hypothetical protein BIY24_07400 [Halobacteriovorax marinus]